MKYKGFIVSFLMLFAIVSVSKAQENKVIVEKDSLIGLLQEFRSFYALNPTASKTVSLEPKTIDKSRATRVKVRGFRVQIFSGSSRRDAENVQRSFQSQNSDINAYLDYVEPNYRVKVGDFTSRSAATAYMRELRGRYNNVFVFVEDVWTWQ
ncbi:MULTISPECIES: SPOR domain-containing protein [Sphingobacterium]|uniref:SPOR domain-containing protein n=1 Tax=Sphingobacterium TaxID=28453 RepID=UPI00162537E5|nr:MULTISPECIES: SPOR domain-containing protein [Sphingobacterium]MBV2227137.1 SPOR domain-containing protein [Sphingobacterium mizutaii]